jgi:predicted GIY-YIG superfamily endonuclease
MHPLQNKSMTLTKEALLKKKKKKKKTKLWYKDQKKALRNK